MFSLSTSLETKPGESFVPWLQQRAGIFGYEQLRRSTRVPKENRLTLAKETFPRELHQATASAARINRIKQQPLGPRSPQEPGQLGPDQRGVHPRRNREDADSRCQHRRYYFQLRGLPLPR